MPVGRRREERQGRQRAASLGLGSLAEQGHEEQKPSAEEADHRAVLGVCGVRAAHGACLVPHEPQFRGRQVITLHNQRDFIFFRHHRYVFEEKGEGKKRRVAARLQELGPRFTMKLRSLQMGTFDTQHGEYEWKHKPELDTSRRRFHL